MQVVHQYGGRWVVDPQVGWAFDPVVDVFWFSTSSLNDTSPPMLNDQVTHKLLRRLLRHFPMLHFALKQLLFFFLPGERQPGRTITRQTNDCRWCVGWCFLFASKTTAGQWWRCWQNPQWFNLRAEQLSKMQLEKYNGFSKDRSITLSLTINQH